MGREYVYSSRNINKLMSGVNRAYKDAKKKEIDHRDIIIRGGQSDRHAIYRYKHKDGAISYINSNDTNNMIAPDVFANDETFDFRIGAERKKILNEDHCILNAIATRELHKKYGNNEKAFLKRYNEIKNEIELYKEVDLANNIRDW